MYITVVATLGSDFIAYFVKQPLPFKFIAILQWFPSETRGKKSKLGKYRSFWIENREKFVCQAIIFIFSDLPEKF